MRRQKGGSVSSDIVTRKQFPVHLSYANVLVKVNISNPSSETSKIPFGANNLAVNRCSRHHHLRPMGLAQYLPTSHTNWMLFAGKDKHALINETYLFYWLVLSFILLILQITNISLPWWSIGLHTGFGVQWWRHLWGSGSGSRRSQCLWNRRCFWFP